MQTFPHSKLRVYTAAQAFFRRAATLARSLPRDRAWFADQLLRAAGSIPLNIAEGSAEFSRKDKARFYRFALRSTAECAAVLEMLTALGLLEETAADQEIASLAEIAAMLTALIRRVSG